MRIGNRHPPDADQTAHRIVVRPRQNRLRQIPGNPPVADFQIPPDRDFRAASVLVMKEAVVHVPLRSMHASSPGMENMQEIHVFQIYGNVSNGFREIGSPCAAQGDACRARVGDRIGNVEGDSGKRSFPGRKDPQIVVSFIEPSAHIVVRHGIQKAGCHLSAQLQREEVRRTSFRKKSEKQKQEDEFSHTFSP